MRPVGIRPWSVFRPAEVGIQPVGIRPGRHSARRGGQHSARSAFRPPPGQNDHSKAGVGLKCGAAGRLKCLVKWVRVRVSRNPNHEGMGKMQTKLAYQVLDLSRSGPQGSPFQYVSISVPECSRCHFRDHYQTNFSTLLDHFGTKNFKHPVTLTDVYAAG